jgi:hypothetical protein
VTKLVFHRFDKPEGVVFKNRHCALCHGVNDVESFDVKCIVPDELGDDILSNLANLSKSEKIDHMVLRNTLYVKRFNIIDAMT